MFGLTLNLSNLAVTQQTVLQGSLGVVNGELFSLTTTGLWKQLLTTGSAFSFEHTFDTGKFCRMRTLYVSGSSDGEVTLTVSTPEGLSGVQTLTLRGMTDGQVYRYVLSRELGRSRFWTFTITGLAGIRFSLDELKVTAILQGDYHR